jgi:hypothetical protein
VCRADGKQAPASRKRLADRFSQKTSVCNTVASLAPSSPRLFSRREPRSNPSYHIFGAPTNRIKT